MYIEQNGLLNMTFLFSKNIGQSIMVWLSRKKKLLWSCCCRDFEFDIRIKIIYLILEMRNFVHKLNEI